MDIVLRPARSADAEFLTEMLVEAAFWRPDAIAGTLDDVLAEPSAAHYVSNWPQPGDMGVIAEAGQPIGAAWLRFFTADDPGYGFIDAATPEVAMGVARSWRSRGVGRQILQALISTAGESGLPALSLSVEPDNYARELYADLGFDPVMQRDGSIVMRLQL